MKFLKGGVLILLPFFNEYRTFSKAKLQSSYLSFLKFRLGITHCYWPKHKNCIVANIDRIYIGMNSLIGRPGAYLQGAGELFIGDYVQIAPNVGILSANHDLYDQRISVKKKVIIGNYCWIGMNSVILPGVTLGSRTIVAAGSVVTKSFPQGYCILGGSPAKIIKELDKEKFSPYKDENEFYGFISKEKFEKLYPEKVQKLRIEINNIT